MDVAGKERNAFHKLGICSMRSGASWSSSGILLVSHS